MPAMSPEAKAMTDSTSAAAVPEYEAFDLGGPLPTGITMLQASAGTGKTFALAALAVRSIAELGLSASELCVVTFTEAATSELRGRIRERIAEAVAHLEAGSPDTTDVVLNALSLDAAGQPLDEAQRSRRLGNLRAALEEFDTATISTIHGFCSRVLAIAGGVAADSPVTSDTDHIAELVNDIFVSRYSGTTVAPAQAEQIANAVRYRLALPDASIHRWNAPEPAPDAKSAAVTAHRNSMGINAIADLVDELVSTVLRQRAEQRRRTYDSLITDARALIASDEGVGAVTALRKRFSLVMIDEFQDTDQVQWSLFRTAFLEGESPITTVLVGDPKQSIYRFRSAELSAYLGGLHYAHTHGRVFSLRVNWRSDRAVLEGLDHIFDGLAFGDDRIMFESVDSAPEHHDSPFRIDGAPSMPVEIRTIGQDTAAAARTVAIKDLVAETVRLLNTATIDEDGITRRLKPSDIGILVRSNADTSAYARALNDAGVPAASSATDSVLGSAAAEQWRRLLEALERSSSVGPARAAATTWFLGLDAPALVALSDDELSALLEHLRNWADHLTSGGLPRLMAALRAHGLARRVLASPSGERDLTDLEHIAELLQSATSGRPTSATALLELLTTLSASANDEHASDLLGRRIDRDDDTVKVLTVHKAKGLEFPVVLCPTLWTEFSAFPGEVPHGEVNGRRLLEVLKFISKAKPPKAYVEVADADRVERRGEYLRLLYVALTRAKHRLVVWWNPPREKGGEQPLAKVLGNATGVDWKSVDIAKLVDRGQGTIAEVRASDARPPTLTRAVEEAPDLAVATITRDLHDNWRIWSFTTVNDTTEAQKAGAHQAGAYRHDAPQLGGIDEFAEGDPEAVAGTTSDGVSGVPAVSPLQSAPAGPAFGTLVHSALERVDFTSEDLHPELTSACAALMNHRPLPIAPATLAEGLIHALRSPLGGPLKAATLVELPQTDRLDELVFDLPLAAFDASTIASVMLDHLPASDPLHPWFEQAAAGALTVSLDGMLTGSIDLVARTTIDGQSCFWLADYKTNLISSGDYSGSSVADLMCSSGYALQATIYLVALNRYLRWRLGAAYDPSTQLLGSVYLFLRGMNPDNPLPDPAGAHWFRPPIAAIDALDVLFATGGRP
jgi:exodeoxyribonuclease V beta subunit